MAPPMTLRCTKGKLTLQGEPTEREGGFDQLQRLTKLYLQLCEFQDHLPKWRHVHWQYDGRQKARTGATQIWGPRQITAVSMRFDQLLWAVQNDSVMGHLQNRGSHVVCVEGTYSNNQLSGPGAITYSGGDVLHCLFSEGYIQGPAKLFHHSKEGAHQLKMVGEKKLMRRHMRTAIKFTIYRSGGTTKECVTVWCGIFSLAGDSSSVTRI